MEVILYKNKSSHNTINKVLEEIKRINIVFKQDFNLLNSVLVIKSPNLLNANYLYIPNLNRYYFINNQEIISKNVINVYIEVDVLESFKDDILNSEALIKSSTDYNKYYDDGTYLNEIDKEITNYKSNVTIDYSKPKLILSTLGGI